MEFSTACQYSKLHKNYFPFVLTKIVAPFELVLTKIVTPRLTVEGYGYYLLLVDDFSHAPSWASLPYECARKFSN